jgi:hypothetical protein
MEASFADLDNLVHKGEQLLNSTRNFTFLNPLLISDRDEDLVVTPTVLSLQNAKKIINNVIPFT